ncbi:4-carboxymuconolactone decarboxylase, putative [Paecilomyces variotii No. 5]|uniref:4-carboxymuconolactone decarboxylase, putative n=1 Tax=Byssochlamys spectabilis (strain No. 5 / NBRC 109023) TaxID=1356009 RepID=V5F970_BYSSN|nr:4-carboxymuconolactone decarboxylase, putative [Paecilomyces variotii No. 5]
MRIPYAPSEPPAGSDTSTTKIYNRIAARRRPRPLIPLDLALLHTPPVADGYNSFVGALRTKTIVPQSLLELAICRIAVVNDAVYEWNAHAPLALKAGLPTSVLQYAREVSVTELTRAATDRLAGKEVDSDVKEALEKSGAGEVELAVLLYTDEMTVSVKVKDETFDALKKAFEGEEAERRIVELTAVVAGYNGVSRILVSLDVGENNAKAMKSVQEIEDELTAK